MSTNQQSTNGRLSAYMQRLMEKEQHIARILEQRTLPPETPPQVIEGDTPLTLRKQPTSMQQTQTVAMQQAVATQQAAQQQESALTQKIETMSGTQKIGTMTLRRQPVSNNFGLRPFGKVTSLAHVPESGIDVKEVMDAAYAPATNEDFMRAHREFELALKASVPVQQWLQLRGLIEEDGWSGERLRRTVRWIITHKVYLQQWNVADWFSMPSAKLHPYSWVLSEVARDATAQRRMEGFRIPLAFSSSSSSNASTTDTEDSTTLWRYPDGTDLPFEKVWPR